jgi:hypothetical protein
VPPPTPRKLPAGLSGERLWRLRKLHQQVEAHLHDHGGAGVDLQFFYNGGLMCTRRLENRDGAIAEATEKRVELERGGWIGHW